MLGDRELVNAVLRDFRASALPENEKALLAFVQKVNRDSFNICREDIDAVKGAGWTEEALYDAITVCALFNFYNRWIDAAGVHDMPPEAYAMQAKKLAYEGYVAAPPNIEAASGDGAGRKASA
ncbi:MAG: carboxymuconolactone decarboxylase family protein [Terriglobia bacterium]